jgi:hypothetical protein
MTLFMKSWLLVVCLLAPVLASNRLAGTKQVQQRPLVLWHGLGAYSIHQRLH